MEFSIIVERQLSNNDITLGRLKVVDNDKNLILQLVTLELPWLLNEARISCIPIGKYIVKPHVSPSKGKCLSILNVPSRANILVHSGNYKTDTLGCILVGLSFFDINHDGGLDVNHSRTAMQMLLSIITQPTTITIK